MKTDTCRICGSNKIMDNVRVVDRGHGDAKKDLSVYIQKTDKRFFNKFEKGELKAQICGSCGNVDLSVKNPHELWDAYLKTKSL
ncbi:hypothetical protein [Winogradskyella sp. A3E31]|uniref:hypothetical protein n=1 Tax=Winogradskyella sp. A3E31 TaxID=3349637 RepID=UPI00398B929D